MVDRPGRSHVLGLAIRVIRLGEDDDALPGDGMLLEEFADDDLGLAGGVGVGRVERLSGEGSVSERIFINQYEGEPCVFVASADEMEGWMGTEHVA